MLTKTETIKEAQLYLRDYIWDNWMNKKESSVSLEKNDLIKIQIKNQNQEIEAYVMFITHGMNENDNKINIAISMVRKTSTIQHHFINVLQTFEYRDRHNLVMQIDESLEKLLYIYLEDVKMILKH